MQFVTCMYGILTCILYVHVCYTQILFVDVYNSVLKMILVVINVM